MTPLFQYLDTAKITQKHFAQRLGVTQATVSRLASGRAQPTAELARKIEDETGGKVPALSWPAFRPLVRDDTPPPFQGATE